MKKISTKRIALLGALTSAALTVFVVESLFPPLFVPGAKMGLSNIFTMLAVVLLSPWEALLLVIVRTVLGSFFAGGLASLMYSLPAGVAAVLLTSVMWKNFSNHTSLVSTAVAVAVLHNIVQLSVFCAVTRSPQLFSYLPWLALAGVLAGAVVGSTAVLALKHLPLKKFFPWLEPVQA